MEKLKKMIRLFQREEKKKTPSTHEREFRDLLRENLKTYAVDVFYHDDPLVSMSPDERNSYLAYFHGLTLDKKLINRLRFWVNKQANITLKESVDGELDTAGIMKMDGTSCVIDDINRLSAMYQQEESIKVGMSEKDALRL